MGLFDFLMEAYEAEKFGFEFDERVLTAESKDPQTKRPVVTSVPASLSGNLAETIQKHALKTGTTICGCISKDCVVLAADTRSTVGSQVADKHCFKLHKLCNNIWCAGAGVAADLDHVTMTLAAELQIFSRQINSMPRVETCVTRLCSKLFRYQGHIVTALIIGGVNPTGEMALYYVSPNGYSHSLPYMAMGSGGFFAQSILEANYKDGMSREEAMNLCGDAIEAGVMNDLGSGTGCDLVTISLEDPEHPVLVRSFRTPIVGQKIAYTRKPMTVGKTVVLKETRTPVKSFDKNQLSLFL